MNAKVSKVLDSQIRTEFIMKTSPRVDPTQVKILNPRRSVQYTNTV